MPELFLLLLTFSPISNHLRQICNMLLFFPYLGIRVDTKSTGSSSGDSDWTKGKAPTFGTLTGRTGALLESRLRPIGCATWRQSAVSPVSEFLFAFICLRTWISLIKNGSKSRVDIFQKEFKKKRRFLIVVKVKQKNAASSWVRPNFKDPLGLVVDPFRALIDSASPLQNFSSDRELGPSRRVRLSGFLQRCRHARGGGASMLQLGGDQSSDSVSIWRNICKRTRLDTDKGGPPWPVVRDYYRPHSH